MRKICFAVILLVCSSVLFAEELNFNLKSGSFKTELGKFDLSFNQESNYRYMFFETLPTVKEQDFFKSIGISFLEYIPKNIYIVDYSIFSTQ